VAINGMAPHNIPKEKKSKSALSAGKFIVTAISPYFLPKKTTVSSNNYTGTLRRLKAHEFVPHINCLKCCSSMTTLGHTQMCA
jgi:hypothetical protein